MRHISLVLLGAAALASSGCVASLEGGWDGQVDCGDMGSVDMTLDITSEGGRSYSAEGNIQGFVIDGLNSAVLFDMEIDQPKARGAQVLEVKTSCALYQSEGAPQKVDCYEFDELGWDGADLIEAEVENFLDTGAACAIELER